MSKIFTKNLVENSQTQTFRLTQGRVRRFALIGDETLEYNARLCDVHHDQGAFWSEPLTPDQVWLRNHIKSSMEALEGNWALVSGRVERLPHAKGKARHLPYSDPGDGTGLVMLYTFSGPTAATISQPTSPDKRIRLFKGVMIFVTDNTSITLDLNEEPDPAVLLWSHFRPVLSE